MAKYLFLLLCALPALLGAQGDTTQYPFVAYWSKSNVYKFGVSKIKLKYQNDSLGKADTTSYQSVFEVMDPRRTATSSAIPSEMSSEARRRYLPSLRRPCEFRPE